MIKLKKTPSGGKLNVEKRFLAFAKVIHLIKGVEKMIYNKPELNTKKFDLAEEIMESGNSATDPTEPDVDIKSKSGSSSIGSDLIIG